MGFSWAICRCGRRAGSYRCPGGDYGHVNFGERTGVVFRLRFSRRCFGCSVGCYTLGLQSTAGELIGAVDVSITGQLHQRWTFDEDSAAMFLPTTSNSGNITNGDSHLRAVTGAMFGAGPIEDNPGTGSPLARYRHR